MNKSFLQFFKDGTDSFSATRLGFFAWVLGVLGVWIVRSIDDKGMPEIDNSILTMIGILMTGKAVQSFSENEAPHKQQAPAAEVAPSAGANS